METANESETLDITSPKTKRRGRWKPGESGNPKGNHRGGKHRATLFAEALFSGECEVLVRKVIELAKAGDVGALRLCVERLLPPLKPGPFNSSCQHCAPSPMA
jgi:hypothetical protein